MLVPTKYAALLLAFMVLAGCNGTPTTSADSETDESAASTHEHAGPKDDNDEPESLAAALDELRKHKAALDKCFADKDISKADSIVHELGHTLEHLSEFVKQLPDDEQAELKKPLDALFEQFGKLDEDIHAGKEIQYDEVSKPIDEDISALQEHIAH